MAEVQANDISKYVQVRDYFERYQRSDETLPRVYFVFEVYNKSVFHVVIEGDIAGYIQLNGNEQFRKPETMESITIPPSSSGRLIIDQHVSREQYDLVVKCESNPSGALFYFNKLIITVRIATPHYENKHARLELPQFLTSKFTKDRIAIELKELQQHSANIEKLTLALGTCYLAYKQIRRGKLLSEEDYQTLKDDIGYALVGCYGSKKGDEYFDQQPPFPSTLEEQDKWVDLQCMNLRNLIGDENK